MPTVNLSPIFNGWQGFSLNGLPLAGGLINTYQAGTVTTSATYTTNAGNVANTNPIQLDSSGHPPFEIWLVQGQSYKFVLTDSLGLNPITYDNIQGIDVNGGKLRTDLADQTSALNGAGLVAYNSALSYANGTVGGALIDFGSTASAAVGAGLVAFSPAFGATYGSATIGSRVNKTGHSSNTNTILGLGVADDHLLTGTVGYRTTVVGSGAGAAIGSAVTAGGSNSYYGFGSGAANTEGSGNCFYGALSASANITGDHNNIFGYRALDKHTNGAQNNVFGFNGLFSLTSGNNNSGFGESVLYNMTTGNGNVAVGMNALWSRTVGDFAVAVGFQSSFEQTTALGNTAVGKESLYSFTTQGENTAVGYEALRGVAGGVSNTGIGYRAITAINGGTFNTGTGWSTLLRLTTGSSNTAYGQQSGSFLTTGGQNVCVGDSAGAGMSTASQCVAVGSATLSNINGNDNTAVGWNAAAPGSAQTWTNTTSIGSNAQPTASNQVTLGNTSVATLRCQVTTITAISDERDKYDIGKLGDILPESFFDEDIAAVYRWSMRDGTDRGDAVHAGVIAQNLKDIQSRHGMEILNLVNESNPDQMEATPGNLLIPAVVELKRLRSRVSILESQVAQLLEAQRKT